MNRKQILGFAIGPLAAGVLSAVSLPMMTWLFPPDMIGKLSMLQVATSFFTLLCCFGLDQAYVREFHESRDKSALFVNAISPGIVVLLVLLTGIMSFSPSLISMSLFGERSIAYSVLIVLCLVSVYVSRFLSLILRMQDRGFAFSMSQLFSKVVLLVLVLGYAWLVTQPTFSMLLAAQTTAFLMTLAVFSWNTRRDWWPAIYLRPQREQVARLLDFGWPLIFGGLASWGLSTMDRMFLRSTSTYEELAIYSVASNIASAITVFAGIFNIIWAPMVYRWVSNNTDMKRLDVIGAQMTVIAFLVICGMGGSSWMLQYLLPESYKSVRYLVVGCMISPVLYTLAEVSGIGIVVGRRTVFSLIASLGAVILNGGLCYLFVPTLGAAGAMISSVCAFFLYFILRTEFSSVIWRKSRRSYYYSYMGVASLLAILFSFYGPIMAGSSILFWWALFLGATFYNRRMLKLTINFAWTGLRGKFESERANKK